MDSGFNETSKRDGNIAGVMLVFIGLFLLAIQFLDFAILGDLVLPAIALIFLGWGVWARHIGFLIPGGILAGIGADALILPLLPQQWHGDVESASFMLAFAGGWALISLLSPFTRQKFQWWPLIPGGIMAALGLFMLVGDVGSKLAGLSRYAWPLVLIILGLAIILRRNKPSSHTHSNASQSYE